MATGEDAATEQASAGVAPRGRPRALWRAAVKLVRWCAAIGALALGGLLLWTGRPYLLDLAMQFGVFVGVGSALLCAALLATRRDAPALLALTGTLLIWSVLLRDYRSAAPAREGATVVRVAFFNAHGRPLSDAFLAWVDRVQPDVLCIVESPPALFAMSDSPLARLPHTLPAGPSWRVGDSVLSRFPITVVWPTPEDMRERPVLRTVHRFLELELPDGSRTMLATHHPPSPRTPEIWRASIARNETIGAHLSGLAAERGLPCIVAGDMNSTPTGRSHRAFARASGMRSWTPLVGAGTWPASFSRWLSLPIDRIWTTPGTAVTSYTVGPAFSSDHRPIVAEIALPTP